MHEVLRPSELVYILVDCSRLRRVIFFAIAVQNSLKCSDRKPPKLHAEWEDHVEPERAYNGVSNIGEPVLIEVRDRSIETQSLDNARGQLICKICSAEHRQDSSVEELTDENDIRDVNHL